MMLLRLHLCRYLLLPPFRIIPFFLLLLLLLLLLPHALHILPITNTWYHDYFPIPTTPTITTNNNTNNDNNKSNSATVTVIT